MNRRPDPQEQDGIIIACMLLAVVVAAACFMWIF